MPYDVVKGVPKHVHLIKIHTALLIISYTIHSQGLNRKTHFS